MKLLLDESLEKPWISTNLKALALAVVVLEAHSNKLAADLPLMANLESALRNLEPRSFVSVKQP